MPLLFSYLPCANISRVRAQLPVLMIKFLYFSLILRSATIVLKEIYPAIQYTTLIQ